MQSLPPPQRKLGITTVYSTHDPAEAAVLADRVAIMQDGRIEQTGTVEQLKQQLLQRSLLKKLAIMDQAQNATEA